MYKAKSKLSGFTIVELLVVIVVIGILAAITVVSYTGISQKAIAASLQSDLSGASKQLKMYQVEYSGYPAGIVENPANSRRYCPNPDLSGGRYCFRASPGNTFDILSYLATTQTFSLTAGSGSTSYVVTHSSAPTLLIFVNLTAIAVISGTTQVGQTLSAGALTPSNATVSYQWQNSTTSNGDYSNIVGANSNTYNLSSSDWNMFIKVVATGTGSFTGTQISPATIIVSDPNWIAGIGVLSGKFVRSTDAGGSTKYAWGPYPGSCVSPQCALGIDPSFPSYFSLVNPQTNPGVDFSAYPAQNACKAIGGRLPNMQELTAIHTDRASYGNNFRSFSYLSATEYGNVWNEWGYNFFDVGNSNGYSKNDPWYVRCVAG